jgi:mRNA-degrading endonuclease RelE of RelBE toxin-antitoxin system
MHIILERDFLKSAKLLPNNIKKKLANQLVLFEANPYNQLLHTKRLSGELTGFLSFRITRDWRVLFYFENPETIHILEVDNRKDIYR